MSGNETDRLLDAAIKESIRSMPDQAMPEGFSARVMGGLAPKKPSILTRLKLWLNDPFSMTFTPLQVAPVVTCALALLVLGIVQMNDSVPREEPQLSTVRFMLSDDDMSARTVSVIGSFNSWHAERSVMWYNKDEGKWILEAVLPPGDHEYVFLVDGKKLVPDPQAALTRDDGFGNKNSILFVSGAHEQAL